MVTISIIGAGKVAQHFGQRFAEKGFKIRQIFNRSQAAGRALAEKTGAVFTDDFSKISPGADLFLIAVKDGAIAGVAQNLAKISPQGLVVHTSGATASDVLEAHFSNWGVFWPLQSFSLGKRPVWAKTPICVEAASENSVQTLEKLARKIGAKPFRATGRQRQNLHLAAVFANNFSNHCFAVAAEILRENGLGFQVLQPILQETLAKALLGPPEKMQTGPAIRGDWATVEKHLSLLEGHENWRRLYLEISKSINPSLLPFHFDKTTFSTQTPSPGKTT